MGDEATHAVRARSFVGRSSREGAQWEVDTIASATRRRTATNGRTSHGLLWSGFVNRGEWAAPTAALSRSRKLAVDALESAYIMSEKGPVEMFLVNEDA